MYGEEESVWPRWIGRPNVRTWAGSIQHPGERGVEHKHVAETLGRLGISFKHHNHLVRRAIVQKEIANPVGP